MAIQISDVTSLPDVLLTNHFELVIPTPPIGDGQALVIRNMKGVLPVTPEIETVTLILHRHGLQQAGKAKRHGSFTAVYTDMSDRKVTDVLEGWYVAIQDPDTGLPNPASGYKATAIVRVLDATNEAVIARTFYGLWIGKVQEVDLDGSGNEAIQYRVTFNYDYFTLAGQ